MAPFVFHFSYQIGSSKWEASFGVMIISCWGIQMWKCRIFSWCFRLSHFLNGISREEMEALGVASDIIGMFAASSSHALRVPEQWGITCSGQNMVFCRRRGWRGCRSGSTLTPFRYSKKRLFDLNRYTHSGFAHQDDFTHVWEQTVVETVWRYSRGSFPQSVNMP